MKPCTRVPALLLLLVLLVACDNRDPNDYLPANRISGEAMGSYYRITYLGDRVGGLQESVDSLLEAYNLELSPWEEESTITRFNRSDTGVTLAGTHHFVPNLELAAEVVRATEGAYDPTVAPLVTYWGFGTADKRKTTVVDTAELNAIRKLVGFELIRYDSGFLHKELPGVALDLNASAKGYGVDLISELLTELGRPNHLIDIGGEMRAGGTKNGRPWTVAIRLPEEDARQVAAAGTLPLENGRAIATSGNYLNYYKVDGETYSHTINPRTGYVERNRLLSASILADDCATADAYATACMVLGPDRALQLIEQHPEMDGYFLVRGTNDSLEIRATAGLREKLEEG
ncbi:thiamine biosynthesis lipoprotein [Lewinella marina]|uniref:FAD:protein FMN transferase n=1 Tax=Neolewinella marina TaxID=438751 RepID=A0A2G0CG59_9BACT|nr:FAD:protein FMN transferase [Neolewinella marina]NJB86601.1 thiamine biosynthesis lipoprotein [Neolewinella marina]PHK98948.1 thiamine biosynthesis protein ApbE [Neolewinella marina]